VGRTLPVRPAAAPGAEKNLPETALAAPVTSLLEELGFTVRSEVRGCDLVAQRGDELLVVELKTKPGMALLVQAARRQSLADSVYVAVPEPAGRDRNARRAWLGFRMLLRRLGIGLITVTFGKTPRATLLDDPSIRPARRETKQRARLVAEWRGRSGDDNTAGSTRRVLMTSYREAALYLACCLDLLGENSPKGLVALGATPRAGSILLRNFYGWFERLGPGRYGLHAAGKRALADFTATTERCREKLETRLAMEVPVAVPMQVPMDGPDRPAGQGGKRPTPARKPAAEKAKRPTRQPDGVSPEKPVRATRTPPAGPDGVSAKQEKKKPASPARRPVSRTRQS
jgi:hypothetical protein